MPVPKEDSSQFYSDDDLDDTMMFCLTDLHHDADAEDGPTDSHNDSESSGDEHQRLEPQKELPKSMSLRQRRRSKLGYTGEFSKLRVDLNRNSQRYNSNDSGFDDFQSDSTHSSAIVGSPKINSIWLKALKKIKTIKDPWENFHLEELPEEECTRYRYNALKKAWRSDKVVVKMEKTVSRCPSHIFVLYS